MSKRRLLVTGRGGFVGRTVAKAVASEKWGDTFELVPFVDPITKATPDLRDPEAVDRAVSAATPDAVLHLAAMAAPREARAQPVAAWQVNVMGTLHLARSVLRNAPSARFIYAGSSEAYGATFNRIQSPIKEEALLEPMATYGATKAAADIMLRQMAYDGLKSIIFRPFNHTGPGQARTYVVPAFASQVAQIEAGLRDPVMTIGNLEAVRDFLDVRDIADAYLTAASRDDVASGETFNLSTSTPVAVSTLLEMLVGTVQTEISLKVVPELFVPNAIPVMSGNNSKAKALLGWAPSIPLSQTITDVLDEARAGLKQ